MAHATHSLYGYGAAAEGGSLSLPEWAAEVNPAEERRREIRIANAILEIAQAEAACLGGAQLLRVGVNIGADCDIDIKTLDDVLKVIRQGTVLENINIHLSISPRIYLCHSCGCEFSSQKSQQRCRECSSPACELVGGDELELGFIEVVRA